MKDRWEKFRHRTLTKVFLGYAVVAWVLIQVIETVLPTFETPLWVAQTIIFLLILGFPIAILVGWASEKLPSLSEDSVNSSAAPELAHSTEPRTLMWVGLASCVTIGLFGFYMMPFIFDQEAFSSRPMSVAPQERPGMNSFTPDSRPLRTTVSIGRTYQRGTGTRSDIALSPDGNTLVYVNLTRPIISIMIKELDSFSASRQLATAPCCGASGFPFFSLDGRWVYYYDSGTLTRIRIEGGASQALAPSAGVRGVTELDSDNIIYPLGEGGLEQLTISTGEKKLAVPELADTYLYPSLIPGTRFLLVTKLAASGAGDSGTELIDLDSGQVKTIVPIGYNARYINTGHLVFVRGDSLWAQPFEIETAETTGPAVPAILDLESVSITATHGGTAAYSFSNFGRLAYIPGNLSENQGIGRAAVWVDEQGNSEPVGMESADHNEITLSPDGTQIAMATIGTGGDSDIWVFDTRSNTLGRRTFEGNARKPIWSPDGTTIFYQNNSDSAIWSVSSDGTQTPSIYINSPRMPWPETMSPDGSSLIYSAGAPPRSLVMIRADGERIQETLNIGPGDNRSSAISHDGNWIAYSSNETGEYEVYVRPFPEVENGKWQISRAGGGQPIWSKAQNKIFYWAPDNRKWATAYNTGTVSSDSRSNTFVVGATEELFTGPYQRRNLPAWDYSHEEEKFILMLEAAESEIEDQITLINIVENWDEELRFISPANPNGI